MEEAKKIVINYIKSGQLSKENAQMALKIYAHYLKQNKKLSIEKILESKGYLIQDGSADYEFESDEPVSIDETPYHTPINPNPVQESSVEPYHSVAGQNRYHKTTSPISTIVKVVIVIVLVTWTAVYFINRPEKIVNGKDYKNKYARFTIPRNWTIDKKEGLIMSPLEGDNDDFQENMGIAVSICRTTPGEPYVDIFIKGLGMVSQDFELIRKEEVDIGYEDGYLIECKATLLGQKVHDNIYIIFKNKKTHILTCTMLDTPESRKHMEMFERILYTYDIR